jgi:hypothetical protein
MAFPGGYRRLAAGASTTRAGLRRWTISSVGITEKLVGNTVRNASLSLLACSMGPPPSMRLRGSSLSMIGRQPR